MPRRTPKPSSAAVSKFQPRSRADWRRWLARRHKTASGVWLVYLKGARRQIGYDEAVEEALCFGWIDSVIKPIDSACYMQWFTPRKAKSHWSQLNKSRVKKLIAAGLMAAAGLVAIEAAKKNGGWTALDAVEALIVPPEFDGALSATPAARAAFDRFSPSSRKMYLHWINNAKRPETRAQRVAEAVALIARGIRGPHLRTGG